jgi:hypothetical protein
VKIRKEKRSAGKEGIKRKRKKKKEKTKMFINLVLCARRRYVISHVHRDKPKQKELDPY